jgi:hypothetical protein
MHSVGYSFAPHTFDNIWLTNVECNIGHNLRNRDFFIMAYVRIELFPKFHNYALPLEWNSLGENIRLQHNRTT